MRMVGLVTKKRSNKGLVADLSDLFAKEGGAVHVVDLTQFCVAWRGDGPRRCDIQFYSTCIMFSMQ